MEEINSILKSVGICNSWCLETLPAVDDRHLLHLTDDTGLLQHATFSVANRNEGYCVDDNARGLIYTVLAEENGYFHHELDKAQGRYLSFILHAYNSATGRFRNFMSFDRKWLEESGSEDSHGRTIWSLGVLVNRSKSRGRKEAVLQIFRDSLDAMTDIRSPRAIGFSILGLSEYLSAFPNDARALESLRTLASQLCNYYRQISTSEWKWFEPYLTYCNARLSQAMIVAGETLNDDTVRSVGLESLAWLQGVQTTGNGIFWPVGSMERYERGASKPLYDQQPVEAAASVSAYLEAWKATGESEWLCEAARAFCWFLGANSHSTSIYDKESGGCFDGIHPNCINGNQGAESTLSFLCSRLEIDAAMQGFAVSQIVDAKSHG